MRTCMMLISMLLSCVHILVYKRNFILENFVLINDANENYTNSCIDTEHISINLKQNILIKMIFQFLEIYCSHYHSLHDVLNNIRSFIRINHRLHRSRTKLQSYINADDAISKLVHIKSSD